VLAPAKPAKKAAAKKAAPAKAPAKKAAAKPPEPDFTPEDDDEDETEVEPDEPDEDEDEGEVYDEETLKALPLGALRAVARDFDVDVKGKNATAIIAEIMASGEAVDDDADEDEPPY